MPKKKCPYANRNGFAYIYVNRKPVSLKAPDGSRCKSGTQEALAAYHRWYAQYSASGYVPPMGKKDVTVNELTAAYLEDLKERDKHGTEYIACRVVVKDFLLKLYWDTPVDTFSPAKLDSVRKAMKQSQRFIRSVINRNTRRIIGIFKWGVWKELCQATTYQTLALVPPYKPGEPGTAEGTKRQPVSDDILRRTIKYAVPTEAAMIKLQRLTGARPSEICNLTVGAVQGNKIILTEHKTAAYVGERTIILRPEALNIIAPYLTGKRPENAVFSPRQAQTERQYHPRNKVEEFYNRRSYYYMVQYLIQRANKAGENIPRWFPYQIRHATATADGNVAIMKTILKPAMERLGHTNTKMTENYAHVKEYLDNALTLTGDNPFTMPAGEV